MIGRSSVECPGASTLKPDERPTVARAALRRLRPRRSGLFRTFPSDPLEEQHGVHKRTLFRFALATVTLPMVASPGRFGTSGTRLTRPRASLATTTGIVSRRPPTTWDSRRRVAARPTCDHNPLDKVCRNDQNTDNQIIRAAGVGTPP